MNLVFIRDAIDRSRSCQSAISDDIMARTGESNQNGQSGKERGSHEQWKV